MPTSPTDPVGERLTRLVFIDETAGAGRWVLVDGTRVIERGNGEAAIPEASRTVLAVPGDRVAISWLDLGEGLAPAQAAAAARMKLADASAEPLSTMHVAVGRSEGGLMPTAMVPTSLMSAWLAAAAAADLDPDAIVPTSLLLAAPEAGFVRRDLGEISDFRALGAAFTLEPELAGALVSGSPVETIEESAFEAQLAPVLAAPAINLRQGSFARRRQWRLERVRTRRLALFAIVLALLTLAVQVAIILSYTFAADRAREETQALDAGASGSRATGPGFGAIASVLFDAVRATPNAEVARIDYRADGTLVATVTTDSPATLSALQGRIEAAGLTVVPGQRSNAVGRAATEITLRAR